METKNTFMIPEEDERTIPKRHKPLKTSQWSAKAADIMKREAERQEQDRLEAIEREERLKREAIEREE